MSIQRQKLESALEQHPRVRLAHLPTPLERCERLSAELGGPPIWVKRDDLTGLAMGGNKTRQLEHVFADVLAKEADCIVIGAYTQSNWCRQATAAATRLGLGVHLVLLHGEKGPLLQGNLLLDRLMGADVRIVDLPSMELLQPELDATFERLRREGRRPYMIEPLGIDNLSLGALGYVGCALELDRQFDELGIDPARVYLCGANMTPAGLALGLKALGRRARITNIAPITWSIPRDEDIVRIANATAERLGIETRLATGDLDNHDEFIGERYGLVTDAGNEALRLAARTEALLLDPVYSAKAMSGLVAHVREGRITGSEPVIFLHTGGNPALFAYAQDLGLS
ncbi:MAG: D-cysteine desulfhydrase family protein [Geminicoccaceae bacterium]